MIQIREAAKKDLKSILCLYREAQIDQQQTLCLDEAETLFARMKSYPDYRLFVAQKNHKTVGSFALLIMDNLGHSGTPSAIVEDVAVHPEHQRQGIGKAMMKLAISLSREAGCYKLLLSSNLGRKDAHAFYEAMGFEKHGFSFRLDV